MKHKIVRADGVTVVTEFKSFRYVEQVNDESNLRYGTVISSFIEAEVYGSPSSAIQEGEVLTYYQIYDTDNEFNSLPEGTVNEFKIGVFTASVTLPSKNTYSFTAFDNISKLDVDFSSVLKANEQNFPMSVVALTTLVANTANVTIDISQCPLHNRGNDVKVQFFYADGITCRQIISYIAEVSGSNIYCYPNGKIVAQPYVSDRSLTIPLPSFWWKDNYHYIICPTDTVTYTGTDSVGNPITLIPVYYKQDGFEKANYTCEALDTFSVKKTSGEDVWGMIGQNPNDIYEINSNPIIDHIVLSDNIDWDDIMMVVDGEVEDQTLKGIVPFTIRLFPFRNPFRAGEFVPYIQGADGVRFRSLIMKMEVTDSEAVLYCYGDEKWHVSSQLTRTSDEMNVAIMGSKVSKSGDTMTGSLYLKDDRINLDVIPSSSVYGRYLGYRDSQDRNYFYHQVSQFDTGQISSAFNISNRTTGGTTVNHRITMRINKDGTREVAFTEVDPWLAALGLLTATSTTTISDVGQARSNFTPTAAEYVQYGKVAQIRIRGTMNTAISAGSSATIFTLASGKRPKINTPIITSNSDFNSKGYVNAYGNIVINANTNAIAVNSVVLAMATYILA